MLLLATLLVGLGVLVARLTLMSARPRPALVPQPRSPAPPSRLPDELYGEIFGHLSASLLFADARSALLACGLVSRSFFHLAQQHKDDHLLVSFVLHVNPDSRDASGYEYRLAGRSLAQIRAIVRLGRSDRVRSVEVAAAGGHAEGARGVVMDAGSDEALFSLFPSLKPYLPLFRHSLLSLTLNFPILIKHVSEDCWDAFWPGPLCLNGLVKLRALTLVLSTNIPAPDLQYVLPWALPKALASCGRDPSLSVFRLTFQPFSTSDITPLTEALAELPGFLPRLTKLRRIRAVDGTAFGAGWHDKETRRSGRKKR